jgi:hypothetical protein
MILGFVMQNDVLFVLKFLMELLFYAFMIFYDYFQAVNYNGVILNLSKI